MASKRLGADAQIRHISSTESSAIATAPTDLQLGSKCSAGPPAPVYECNKLF